MKKLFAFLIAPFLAASLAYAQPAQWNYSDPGNVSTATYPGNVNILGTCTVQGVSCGGGSTPSNIVTTVANIAALKAIGASASSMPSVYVTDYGAAGSGGGGLFVWDNASTATTDVCVTFAATGIVTGRYVRQLAGGPLSLPMCGVVADNSTDNTVPLQAAFTALNTYQLGEIYCPASPSIIKFSGTITPIAGGTLRGQNNTLLKTLGQAGNVPGACHFAHSGTGWAFDFQTPFLTGVPCAIAVGPKFYNFTIEELSTGSSFRVNDGAIAGFSDDCAATGGGQSVVFGTTFDGIIGSSEQRDTWGIQLNKAFDSVVTNSKFSFYGTQISVIGSDNVLLVNNKHSFATTRAIDIQSQGTFGNFDSVKDSVFFSVYYNAPDFVRAWGRSGVFDSNYFEADFTGINTVFNVSCSLNQTFTNNALELLPVNINYWLDVTGDCVSLTATNNYGGGGGAVPSRWNAGAGSHWFSNSSKQKIFYWGNPDHNGQVPFVTQEDKPASTNFAPAAAGAVLGSFDASSNDDIGGDGAATTYVGPTGHTGQIEFQPKSGGTLGHITFHVRPAVTGTVDTWILAATEAGTNQQLTCSVGAASATFTLTGGTVDTWYNPAGLSNIAVTDPLIDCVNSDTTHGQKVYVTRWQLSKH